MRLPGDPIPPRSTSGPVEVYAEHFADAAAEFTVYELRCEVCGETYTAQDQAQLHAELGRHLEHCRRYIRA